VRYRKHPHDLNHRVKQVKLEKVAITDVLPLKADRHDVIAN